VRVVAAGALILFLALPPVFGQVSVVPGYAVAPVVTAGLNNPTGLDMGAAGDLYIAQHGVGGSARIGVSFTRPGSARNFATIPDLDTPSGVLVLGPSVYIANRAQGLTGNGQIIKYTDGNGNDQIDGPDEYDVVYSGLPRRTNGVRSIALGPDGLVYVGVGSIGLDSETEPAGVNTKIFRFDPASMETPPPSENFASGFFNPLGVDFDSGGLAFVSDRAPVTVDASDELNVAEGGEYFGFGPPPVPGAIPKAPLVSFPRYSQPAGVAWFPPSEFTGNEEVVFVALEGHPAYPNIAEPAPRVVRVVLNRDGGDLTATVSDFVTGLENPYGLRRTTLPGGGDSLLISDYSTDLVYQVTRKPLDPRDVDESGFVDAGDLYIMKRERDLIAAGTPPDPLLTDFNENGLIDADDLFYFSQGWEGSPEQ
jgi:hypothetical protein